MFTLIFQVNPENRSPLMAKADRSELINRKCMTPGAEGLSASLQWQFVVYLRDDPAAFEAAFESFGVIMVQAGRVDAPGMASIEEIALAQ